jgi:CheY-like chemotaxis protein
MGHKVLLADDSITVQKIVKLTLADEGIEVIAVGNGDLALQQVADIKPDLIMADVFMPGHDGYEVCEFIKSHPEYHQIPVILLVHAFEPFDQARASQVKADCHLTKPFHSIRTLVATVRELIENYAVAYTHTSSQEAALSAPVANSLPESSQPVAVAEAPQVAESVAASTLAETANSAATPGTVSEEFHASAEPLSFDTAKLQAVDVAFGEVVPLKSFSTPESPESVNVSATPADYTSAAASPKLVSEPHASSEAALKASADDMQMLSFTPASLLTLSGTDFSAEPETLSLFSDSAPGAAIPSASFSSTPAVDEVLDLDAPTEIATLAPASAGAIDANVLEEVEDSCIPIPSRSEVAVPAYSFSSNSENQSPEQSEESSTAAGNHSAFFPLPVSAASTTTGNDSHSAGNSLSVNVAAEKTDDSVQEITPPALVSFAPALDFGVGQELAPTTETTAEVSESYFESASGKTETETIQASFSQNKTDSIEIKPQAENAVSLTSEPTVHSEQTEFHAASEKSDSGVSVSVPAAAAGSVISEPALTQSAAQDVASGVVGNPHDATWNAQALPESIIDEIVRRVVAQMSEKAVQEIAWEVVPDLAELLIRKQLAQKTDQ